MPSLSSMAGDVMKCSYHAIFAPFKIRFPGNAFDLAKIKEGDLTIAWQRGNPLIIPLNHFLLRPVNVEVFVA